MKLTINFNATDDVWYAYVGDTPEDSGHIGQGTTAEAACSDYWYQAAGAAAELSYDPEGNWWILSQGYYHAHFSDKQAAIDFADGVNWQLSAGVRT
jgi:hypothetical protein